MDSVHLGNSWAWVKPLMQKLADADLSPEPISVWIEPELLALLIVIFKEWPDSEDDFPNGKWASIQHIESLLSKRAQIDLRRSFPDGVDHEALGGPK